MERTQGNTGESPAKEVKKAWIDPEVDEISIVDYTLGGHVPWRYSENPWYHHS
jgi:hypothetical protein